MPSVDATVARTWVRLHSGLRDQVSRRTCHGFYDGDRLDAFAREQGSVPVVLVIPAMSDVNGALPHPGVSVLQTVLRHRGIRCEVINYNLPIRNPGEPVEQSRRALRMAGFPEPPLPNGEVVPAETAEEREVTRDFAIALRDSGAIDMMSLNMPIPLPGTDMWDALAIDQKLIVLVGQFPAGHPDAPVIEAIRQNVLGKYGENLSSTRYSSAAEDYFWHQIYRLSDDTQILVMRAYDNYNIDASQDIVLKRPAPALLKAYRTGVVGQFYGNRRAKLRMLRHVVYRSSSFQDIAAYLTLLSRKYEPETKVRGRST